MAIGVLAITAVAWTSSKALEPADLQPTDQLRVVFEKPDGLSNLPEGDVERLLTDLNYVPLGPTNTSAVPPAAKVGVPEAGSMLIPLQWRADAFRLLPTEWDAPHRLIGEPQPVRAPVSLRISEPRSVPR